MAFSDYFKRKMKTSGNKLNKHNGKTMRNVSFNETFQFESITKQEKQKFI